MMMTQQKPLRYTTAWPTCAIVRMPNKIEKAIAAAKFGKYTHRALHAPAGTKPSTPGVAYEGNPGVQVWTGRSSDRVGMDGAAIETLGRSSESLKASSRLFGGVVAEGGEVMAARAGSAGEGMGVGEAMERRGSKVPRSSNDGLIA
jgi:hypothetical protein